jgi:hypothetical protein
MAQAVLVLERGLDGLAVVDEEVRSRLKVVGAYGWRRIRRYLGEPLPHIPFVGIMSMMLFCHWLGRFSPHAPGLCLV